MLKLPARMLGFLAAAAIALHPLILAVHLGSSEGSSCHSLSPCPCESRAESQGQEGHDSKGCPLCKLLAALSSEKQLSPDPSPYSADFVLFAAQEGRYSAFLNLPFELFRDASPRAPPLFFDLPSSKSLSS